MTTTEQDTRQRWREIETRLRGEIDLIFEPPPLPPSDGAGAIGWAAALFVVAMVAWFFLG